ncbi:DUF1365 domain-containing protein [Enterobacterales bacterium AE_CKDN230030158-1A_HGKHYDSX7]
MNSRLCQGWVRHRRLSAPAREFRYPMGMLYLDLAELPVVLALSRWLSSWRLAPLCWRERDYLPHWTGQGLALAEAVRRLLGEALETPPDGPIHLLTQPRSWGISFNPVSIYLCHDRHGQLRALVCEVRNTPWRERFHYVLPVDPDDGGEWVVDKAFHVSPFLPRDLQYRMRLHHDERHLHLHMENWRGPDKVFEADLALRCQPLDARNLRRHVMRFPWLSLCTLGAIYWQALRLLLRRAPVHDHHPSPTHFSVGRTRPEDAAHAPERPEHQ